MKRFRLAFATALLLTLIIAACNVLKNEDNTADLRKFMSAFQASLNLSDDEILKQFASTQSKESILSAIHILQNKESEYIECTADFSSFSILTIDDFVTVQVHATFKSKNIDEEYKKEAKFDLRLKRVDKSYVITELKAEEFYSAFALMKNEMEWSVEREAEHKLRQPIYAIAKELQLKFDSVIWFARYNQVNYFYVVNGSWRIEDFRDNKSQCLIGVVDALGNIVVPVEYDFIGTIGFSDENIVEVGKQGKVGYFDIATKQQVIEPVFDFIIPYDEDATFAIVRKDTTYGWLDNNKHFTAGFPSKEVEEWIRTYGFLPKNLRIGYELQGLCEPPTPTEMGRGVVMPSSYLVSAGIFKRIVDGITTTKFPMHGWTEYVETKGSKLLNVGEGLNALITTVTERYLEGREEFYTENKVVFVNDSNDTLAVSSIYNNGEFQITRINDELIEIKSTPTEWYGDTYPEDNGNLVDYSYFKIGGNTITPVKSRRVFNSSEFVKLDSTYLSGSFYLYNPQTETEEETTFLSLATITYMRNEILADYGYRFPTPEETKKFNRGDRDPRFDSIDQFRDQMTEVDQYNIDFLERVINRMQGTAL
jgi:hypothetical protein